MRVRTRTIRSLKRSTIDLYLLTCTLKVMLRLILSVPIITLLQWIAVAIIGIVAYTIVRRLFFHPLAHVPGPRCAAASTLYQTYYCFAGGGSRYYQKIKQLHDQYGMAGPVRGGKTLETKDTGCVNSQGP